MKTLGIEEFCQLYKNSESLRIIDVRTPAEYKSAHIEGAYNIPLDRISAELPKIVSESESIYLICQAGARSQKACEALSEIKYDNAFSVAGGTNAAIAAGLPVIKGDRMVISLERQVRIAAGLLVLGGVLASRFINPDFIWLSAFVGAGLMFAGITNTCGMALLLAKMPWNSK